jgi:hypothetical protein
MHRVTAKYVPSLLSEDKKQIRVDVSKEHVYRSNAYENFLTNIVTGDETWIYSYDVQTKAKSSQWVSKTSPTPNKHDKFGSMRK